MAKFRTTSFIMKQRPSRPKTIVAELWCGEHLLGELSYENEDIQISIFAPPTKKWKVELSEFNMLLNEARRQLLQEVENNKK